MAMINRYTLVQTGVNVVRDVVTSTMGFGGNLAKLQIPASPFSTRHPSHGYPRAEQQTGPRLDQATRGLDDATDRAGRPGCLRILASRSPAPGAGRIIPGEWSLARGRACPTAVWRFGPFAVNPRTSVGKPLPGKRLALCVQGLRMGSHLSRLLAHEATRHAASTWAGRKPASGALSASTRG